MVLSEEYRSGWLQEDRDVPFVVAGGGRDSRTTTLRFSLCQNSYFLLWDFCLQTYSTTILWPPLQAVLPAIPQRRKQFAVQQHTGICNFTCVPGWAHAPGTTLKACCGKHKLEKQAILGKCNVTCEHKKMTCQALQWHIVELPLLLHICGCHCPPFSSTLWVGALHVLASCPLSI